MGTIVRRRRRLVGMMAAVLVLLVQASALSAAMRTCGRAAHDAARTSALAPTHDGAAGQSAPPPGPPAQTADAGACASAADIAPRLVVADVPTAHALPAEPAPAVFWSDPFLRPALRPPRA